MFEVLFLPNDYLSFDVTLHQGTAKLSLSYDYFTTAEAKPIHDLSNKELFVLIYEESTTQLSWSNPDDLFSEFQVYIDKQGTDLSSECLLKELNSMFQLNDNEIVLTEMKILTGNYEVNILEVSKDKIEFGFAYQQKVINYIYRLQVKSIDKPIDIYLTHPLDGFYATLDKYQPNEEGMILVSFESPFTNNIKFYAKVAEIE